MVCELLVNKSVTSLAEVWIEISMSLHPPPSIAVTSLAEVWIEMEHLLISMIAVTVTSLAEVWIEIQNQQDFSVYWLSLPLRKCGLKFASVPDLIYSYGRHFPCGSVD